MQIYLLKFYKTIVFNLSENAGITTDLYTYQDKETWWRSITIKN